MKCEHCKNRSVCIDTEADELIGYSSGIPTHKKYTLADKIRNMSDEELTNFILKSSDYEKILCSNFEVGCWYQCKNNHMCEIQERKHDTVLQMLQTVID